MTLNPAEWEKKFEEKWDDAEKAILAEGQKLADKAREGALKVRKSKLVAELEKIEEELTNLFPAKKESSEPKPEPVAKKNATSEVKADTKKRA